MVLQNKIIFLKKVLNYFFAPENIKNPPSKVPHNWPQTFFISSMYWQLAQNQPKSHFLFHENVSLRDFYLMTLGGVTTVLLVNPVVAPLSMHGEG